MPNKVLITGANRGIGLALTQYYVEGGHTVYATCRSCSSELANSGAIVIEGIDVSNRESVNTIANTLGSNKIDLLINNAGILHSDSLNAIDTNTITQQFCTNALGPLIVTHALLNYLAPGAKIGLITSRMGSMADNTSGGYYGYRMSKAALNAAGVSLAQDLKPQGIAVALLHPGFVQTDMVNHAGDISAETSAERLAQRLEALNLENTGQFWHSNGELLPW